MAVILKGAPVSALLNEKMISAVGHLQLEGITPTLAIVRVGCKEEDLTYERTAQKRCEKVGVSVVKVVLGTKTEPDGGETDDSANVDAQQVYAAVRRLAEDPLIHGILVFRPLPKQVDDRMVRSLIPPEKDVDGCTDGSLAGVFTGSGAGFSPCTAQAVMEILDYYGIDPAGRKAVVVGRSLVIGRPVAMLLMHRNATPVICHSKTKDICSLTKQADILIACTGKTESIGPDYCSDGQVVIDVGINWNETKQKLCGDVDFDAVENIVSHITPVPGGVGGVTTGVLISHVIEAAEALNRGNG